MTRSGAGAADERGDEGAHVPALHAVAVVAEPVHQLGQRGGGAAVRPAGLGQRTGESVAGQRRDHQVEGVGRVAAVRGRVGERADQVEELHDRARPAVQEQQRGGVRLGGAHVQEVQLGAVDRGDELGIGVERRLVRPPVVLLGPVGGEFAQVGGGDAALPAGAGQVAGPAGPGQPLAEVVEVGLRDADAVRPDGGVVVRHVPKARKHWCQVLAPMSGRLDAMLETSARLLRLLSLLQSRRDWTGAELAGRLGVGLRTVRRDIDRLRDLGYPVDARRAWRAATGSGAGAALPPLLLDDEEAVAVAISLHTATTGSVAGLEETALRALTKLQQMLPSRLRHRITAFHATTVPLAGPGSAADRVDPDLLTAHRGGLPGPAAAAPAVPGPRRPSTPGMSSRTGWCTPRAAGTCWPGTSIAATGGPSGSTASRAAGPAGRPLHPAPAARR